MLQKEINTLLDSVYIDCRPAGKLGCVIGQQKSHIHSRIQRYNLVDVLFN